MLLPHIHIHTHTHTHMQVLGHLKIAITLAIGFLFFGAPIIAKNLTGISLAFSGMLLYAYVQVFLSLCLCLSLFLTLSLSHTHTHARAHTHTDTHTHTHTHTQTHTLSLSHTHTNTHTHIHTHEHTPPHTQSLYATIRNDGANSAKILYYVFHLLYIVKEFYLGRIFLLLHIPFYYIYQKIFSKRILPHSELTRSRIGLLYIRDSIHKSR